MLLQKRLIFGYASRDENDFPFEMKTYSRGARTHQCTRSDCNQIETNRLCVNDFEMYAHAHIAITRVITEINLVFCWRLIRQFGFVRDAHATTKIYK